ncbi:hypothetical protein [Clostridium tagluense]|uniref:DUF4375 domain-containing protein n=1 Tax=Clostridium tagluense TaxID=360422 RepID=A0A401UTL8_9CLOT|nr:hypothetical protein [Clostridium tagluense]GCD12895.1 hypothetical protein Ctaglu_45180 [Clostridium tagluense]
MERKIEKWEDLDSVEIIFKLIRFWEYGNGEDFIDSNECIVREIPFACFLLGAGYISKDILNSLIKEDGSLQDLLGGYDDEFNIFPLGECENESMSKKYHLLAEYIFQVDGLRKRLFNVLKNWGYDGSEREENEEEYGVVSLVLDGNDFEKTDEDFGTLHDEWLWVSSHSIEDVNKIVQARNEKEEELN